MKKQNLIFLFDPYHYAPLWLDWGFIDQNTLHSKIAEIGYFIIKNTINTYKKFLLNYES